MPAVRYWDRDVVSPARAKSKSLVARAMASGGSSSIEVGFGGVDAWCSGRRGGEVCCGGRPILRDSSDRE